MRFLWLMLLAVILTGCIPYSDNPLTMPDQEGPDRAVLGTWFLHEEGETIFLHMGINEKNKELHVVMVELQKDGEVKTSELTGHTSRLGNYTYLNLRWDRPEDTEDGYLFVKYQIDGKRIGLGLIRSDAVRTAIGEGGIEGKIEGAYMSSSLRITAAPEQLQDYFQTHDAELFEDLKWMSKWDPEK